MVNIMLENNLPKGKMVKLQPHETAFIELSDPRAILENELRNYLCLKQGETINIVFSGVNYKIDIVEV